MDELSIVMMNRTVDRVNSPGRKLREVATEFESLFVKQMLDSMRTTLSPDSRLVDGGMTEEVFEDMLYDEYAKTIAQTQSLGIADAIVDQLSQ